MPYYILSHIRYPTLHLAYTDNKGVVQLLFAIVNRDNEEWTMTNFGTPDIKYDTKENLGLPESKTGFYNACYLGKKALKTLPGVECTVGHEYYYTVVISLV